jgi:hypothetical protein
LNWLQKDFGIPGSIDAGNFKKDQEVKYRPSIRRLIACGVFKPAFACLNLDLKHPWLDLTFLPSRLHLRPEKLKAELQLAVKDARRCNQQPVVVYGDCFPGINEFCREHGVAKLAGRNCYEMLLGDRLFDDILTETTGTFFVEQELVLNFEAYCVEPLELADEYLRHLYFKHYRQLLHVRQPDDPDLAANIKRISDFLNLPVEIRDADYSHIENLLQPHLQT